jgi:hypothetical protein
VSPSSRFLLLYDKTAASSGPKILVESTRLNLRERSAWEVRARTLLARITA